eukprot:TRINITY_DN24415_c0_g1_i1.p1 TRINITY_DN24415_c0_g1~~TRINITY_DN24415_c0_g1_i1.p1  ORF type:complete len:373 (+),score=132.74 TRINITY_DN24415_c0_g1_i1:128-1246(+)
MKVWQTVALAAVLCGVVLSAQIDAFKQLREIDASEFGQKILDLVQVQFNIGEDRVQIVLDLLTQMRNEILAEQKVSTDTYGNISADCKVVIPTLDEELKGVDKSRVSRESEIDSRKLEIQDQEKQLKEYNELLRSVQNSIDELNFQRGRERAEHEQALSDIALLRGALKRARDILQGLINKKGGNAGAQLSLSFVQLHDTIEKLEISHHRAVPFQKMATVLLQSMSRADPARVHAVFDVIDRILEKLGDIEYSMERADAVKEKVHSKAIANQEALLFSATANIGRIHGVIADISNRITTVSNDIVAILTIAQQKAQELADKKEQCKEAEQDFKTHDLQREDELELIEKVIALIQSHVAPVKEYIQERPSQAP